MAADDIVATDAEAERNERAPLLVLEPLAASSTSTGSARAPIEATPIGEGHSNVTYLLRRGDAEVVLRRPPRPPLPPERARRAARGAPAARARARRRRVPEVLAVVRGRGA